MLITAIKKAYKAENRPVSTCCEMPELIQDAIYMIECLELEEMPFSGMDADKFAAASDAATKHQIPDRRYGPNDKLPDVPPPKVDGIIKQEDK